MWDRSTHASWSRTSLRRASRDESTSQPRPALRLSVSTDPTWVRYFSMIDSPDHLIFLTALIHFQRIAYSSRRNGVHRRFWMSDRDHAFEWLEKAYAERSGRLEYIR